MAGKPKAAAQHTQNSTPATNDTTGSGLNDDSMEQVRKLLFGAEVDALRARSDELANTFSHAIADMKKQLNVELSELREEVQTSHQTTQQTLEKISSQLASKLSDTHTELLTQIQANTQSVEMRLNSTAADLTESKVDRSELSEMFTTMAQRLSPTSNKRD